jgi:hypothetical protein
MNATVASSWVVGVVVEYVLRSADVGNNNNNHNNNNNAVVPCASPRRQTRSPRACLCIRFSRLNRLIQIYLIERTYSSYDSTFQVLTRLNDIYRYVSLDIPALLALLLVFSGEEYSVCLAP